MAERKTLTFALMDPPYENARSTTALRLIHIAAKRGYNINVFAYEGSVFLAFANQKPHPNAMHGRNVEEENHVLTKELVSSLIQETRRNGGKVDWVNCGLCVDERGAVEAVEGVRRGSPADFLKMAEGSDNTLVIGTRG
jgi:tRNA 2-thiouridine synthesizing protein D